MRKKFIGVISLILISNIFFTGCSMPSLSFLSSDSSDDGSGASLNISIASNPQNLDPQTTTDVESRNIICNIMEGLMTVDENGDLVTGVAESYEVSDDGLIYTFKIRDSAMWFYDTDDDDYMDDDEYTKVTADDFVFAFQRIFNPDTESPFKEEFSCIKNGETVASGLANYTSIGVTAIDSETVQFELDYPNQYFLDLLSTTAAMPCNQEFFESTKGRYGLDDRCINSNGPFYIQQWYYDEYGKNNFMYIRRNSDYKENDTVYPKLITINIKNSETDLEDDFSDSSSDVIVTDNYKLRYISSSTYNSVAYQYATLGLIFNNEDKIYSNKNIRKALRYAIDSSSLVEDEDINESACGIVPPSISLLGRSYRELYSQESLAIKQNTSSAKDYFEKGLKELSINSLDNAKVLVCSDSMNSNYLHQMIQQWQDVLGFYSSIDEVGKDEFQTKLDSGEYQIALYELNSDFNSPLSFLNKFNEENNIFGLSSSEIQSACEESEKELNLSDCVDIYGNIENKIIESDCFYPLFYKPVYVISPSDISGFVYNPFSEQLYWKYAKKFS